MCSVEAFPKPRIECIEVESLAAAYSYPLEASMEELVVPVKSRGYLEKSDLVMLAHWKSKRIAKHIAKNDEADVIAATRMALSTDSPKMALHILTLLNGVAFPVASCILHWFHSEKFPILDFRAVWSLGIDQPSAYAPLRSSASKKRARSSARVSIVSGALPASEPGCPRNVRV